MIFKNMRDFYYIVYRKIETFWSAPIFVIIFNNIHLNGNGSIVSDSKKDVVNPFEGLTKSQSSEINEWYKQQVANELSILLKNSQSGIVLEKKIRKALNIAQSNVIKNNGINSDTPDSFSLKSASLLSELKDTRAVLKSAQRKIAILEKQQIDRNSEVVVLEDKISELNNELRSYRKRLNNLLEKSEQQGMSYLKCHFVGRIFVHSLKSSFADWQKTEQGDRFKSKDFYTLFPRVLYSGLLKELEVLIGAADYSKINKTVSSFVFQQKGVPVQDWPDEDPIYQSDLINQKQSELLHSLRSHHERRKNFANYLEKKLEKTGFTPMHSKLLIELIQFATSNELASSQLH